MILLSIHPEYVAKILSGEKTFEFRKRIPAKFSDDKRVAVYSTSPVCKVVGYVEIDSIVKGVPSGLWRRVAKSAGISKSEYDAYFRSVAIAYAYKISKVHRLRNPVTLKSIGWESAAPQSFCYLNERVSNRLVSLAKHAAKKKSRCGR